jgi:ribonuclease H2 subunit C
MNTNTNLSPSSNPENGVHLLPCSIDYDGQAKVSDYFKPIQVEGKPYLEATLRGRLLRGAELKLPKGIHGVVLQQTTPPRSRVLEHQNYAAEQRTFDRLTYWNHDTPPSQSDYLPQAFKLFDLARAVNEPIPVE